jgi:hypothetical protein
MEKSLDRYVVVDCDDDAGLVLAGLRAGLRRLIYRGDAAVLARLNDMAVQLGGEVKADLDLPTLQLESGEESARATMRMWQ